jgi:hypothetical protein
MESGLSSAAQLLTPRRCAGELEQDDSKRWRLRNLLVVNLTLPDTLRFAAEIGGVIG